MSLRETVKLDNRVASAYCRGVPMSPKKFILLKINKKLRHQPVLRACEIISFSLSPKKVRILLRLFKAAIAAAKQKGEKVQNLYVKSLTIGKCVVMKRVIYRARGRVDILSKRHSNLLLELSRREVV